MTEREPNREPPREGKRRRRKRPRGQRRPETPAEIVARAAEAKPLLDGKAIEEPLTADELAELRLQLRFLREHRRVLHLRVNAQEDLLLNEVRQPTRRGVCRHLLAKVDRAQVFSAAERLDPAAATRLAEGVLRITPGVDYLLLYLDCVRRSQSGSQAVAALAHALERIDFESVSPGQMRRVLDLVVELFDARELPAMLLGLLEGKAFREAFDASATELPQALAEIVVPLRAAQAVVLHDKPNPAGAEALTRGIRLLLASEPGALVRRPAGVRRRLLVLAIESGVAADPALANAVRTLFEGLADVELGFELAAAWIAEGREAEAQKLLGAMKREHPDLARAQRWLETLALPRLGRVALGGEPAPRRRAPGVLLDTMQRVGVLFAESPDAAWLEIARGLVLPGVAPLLDSGTDAEGRAWVALARCGHKLTERRRALDRRAVLAISGEIARILAALAAAGVRLPDAHLARFEVDGQGRVWLCDLAGAERAADAEAEHAKLAARVCRELCARETTPPGLLERLDAATSASDVARWLARYGPR